MNAFFVVPRIRARLLPHRRRRSGRYELRRVRLAVRVHSVHLRRDYGNHPDVPGLLRRTLPRQAVLAQQPRLHYGRHDLHPGARRVDQYGQDGRRRRRVRRDLPRRARIRRTRLAVPGDDVIGTAL